MFYGFKGDLEAKSHILGIEKAKNAIKHMEHDFYWAPGDVERRKIGESSSKRERGIGMRAPTHIPTQVQKS